MKINGKEIDFKQAMINAMFVLAAVYFLERCYFVFVAGRP